jgi:hypothetical protein
MLFKFRVLIPAPVQLGTLYKRMRRTIFYAQPASLALTIRDLDMVSHLYASKKIINL